MSAETRFVHTCEHRSQQKLQVSLATGMSQTRRVWICAIGHEGPTEVGPAQCDDCPVSREGFAVADHVEVRIATVLRPGVRIVHVCRECGMLIRHEDPDCWNCGNRPGTD